jgi:trans-aconitate 2-methyltransferase
MLRVLQPQWTQRSRLRVDQQSALQVHVSEWSPAQYEKFADERARPFFDLCALVRTGRPDMRVVDLGCGTGELTRDLHRKLGAASTLGIDSSETMLAKAASFVEPGLSFRRETIEGFSSDAPLDLIFANASLHWVEDHHALLARLATFLAPEGQLAVQIPANDAHVSHRIAAEIAECAPFADALGGWVRVFPNLAIEEYASALYALGFREQHVRMQVYAHVLSSRDEIVEWVKGTLLTAYRERLPAELRAPFEERYRERLREVVPDDRPFFYPFRRILFWAQR